MRKHDLANILTYFEILTSFDNIDTFLHFLHFCQFYNFLPMCWVLVILTCFANFWQFWQSLTIEKLLTVLIILTIMTKTIPVTCDIWNTDYISDNWEPEFTTIYGNTWQLRVTLDSICNSCDVLYVYLLQVLTKRHHIYYLIS